MATKLAARTPPAPPIADELRHVVAPELKVPLTEVRELLDRAEAGLQLIRDEIRPAPELAMLVVRINDTGDRVQVRILADSFRTVMSETVKDLEGEVAAVQKLHCTANEGFTRLLAYFGDNAGALASDTDFWAALAGFVEDLSAAQREAVTEEEIARGVMKRRANVGKEAAPAKSATETGAPVKSTGHAPAHVRRHSLA
jgi:hypothetical protein